MFNLGIDESEEEGSENEEGMEEEQSGAENGGMEEEQSGAESVEGEEGKTKDIL